MKQHGFILVETVFAIAIVGTVVATAAGAMSVSARVMDRASTRTTASWIAVSETEFVREETYLATGEYATVPVPDGFTVSAVVSETPVPETPVQQGDAGIKYVDITVQRNGTTVLTHRIVKVDR